MNSNQLFSPESSAAESKSQGRARVKVAVYSVVAVHVAGLVALLLTQGCRDKAKDVPPPQPDVPAMDTNALPMMDTNVPPAISTNPPVVNDQFPPPVTPPVEPTATKYVVQPGDSFYSIAKAHGVSQKAIEAANPGVDPKKLKLKQEINLPAPGAAPAPTSTSVPAPDVGGPTIYTVKSGDTLSKLATHFGTTPKAIKALNGLATDQIKVNQKLKIPAKATPEPAPVVPTMPASTAPPATAPAH